MTLSELLTALERRNVLRASQVKDYRTAVRYLANALGYDGAAGADTCPVDAASREDAPWKAALEAHWRTLDAERTDKNPVGASTRRNTRSALTRIFTLAAQRGLLAVPVPLLAQPNRKAFERQQQATSPFRRTFSHKLKQPYGLKQAQWPPDVQDGWQQYQAAAATHVRPRSLASYANALESYLGFLAHIVGRTPVWDDVFDVEQLRAFVRWHAARMGRPLTVHARLLVCFAAAAAKVLKLKRPRIRALDAYRNTLPMPDPMHRKRPFDITLATVEAVADAWLTEARVPLICNQSQYPGARRAALFQRGLMLKILVRAPVRQRNLREMRWDHNLYQDPETHHWHLRFIGPELKIEKRGTAFNEYAKDLSADAPELDALLTEWREVHRKKLPHADASDLCFLSVYGNPFTTTTIRTELTYAVESRTGKRFYPHLIRSMVANELIRAKAEPGTVAVILGDTIKTTMTTYYSVHPQTHHSAGAAILHKDLLPQRGVPGTGAAAD